MKKQIYILLFLIIVVIGCKKEEGLPPGIEIIAPYSGQQYTHGDTIFYKFSVSDDENVSNVKVSVNNAANQAVVTHNFINAGKYKEYEGYILSESFAVIGSTHHFVVSATDGENETRLGRQITIYESERKTLGLFVATSAGSNSYDVIQIDTTDNIIPFLSSVGDFLNLQVSSKDKMIYSSGKYNGDLIANNLSGLMVWSEPANTVAGNPAFHGISLYDDIIFVAYDNELIKGYDKNKSVKFTADAGTANYAVKIIKNENVVLTEEYSYPYLETKLKSYYYASGAAAKSKSIGQVKVVDFFNKDANTFIVLGNENNKGKIIYYNFSLNSITEPYQMPSGDTIIAAEHISSDNSIIIQFSSGLYKFNLSNNNLIPINISANFEVLKYDEVRKILIAGNNSTITYYSYPQMQLINSINTTLPVKKIQVLYNR